MKPGLPAEGIVRGLSESEWRAIRESHSGPVIILTQNFVALIDEEHLPLVEGKKWFAVRARSGLIYAHHTAWDGRNVTIRMHRLIAGAVPGQLVDHVNGWGIDNRRANLRLCTRQQNAWNHRKHRASSSRYSGVSFNKNNKNWRALIYTDGRLVSLGSFQNEEDAARAYDAAAIAKRGEFAKLNFEHAP